MLLVTNAPVDTLLVSVFSLCCTVSTLSRWATIIHRIGYTHRVIAACCGEGIPEFQLPIDPCPKRVNSLLCMDPYWGPGRQLS